MIAVLGYGKEGQAVTKYLLKHGIKPVLFDQRPWEGWNEADRLKIKDLNIPFVFGPQCFKELAGFKVAFRSPGIKLLDEDLVKWQKKGLALTSQTKWFFEHCPATIVGVTGTKGKGTTASLIYEVIKCSLPIYRPAGGLINQATTGSVYLTGNIGKEQPLDFLDQLTSADKIVYELSSFQLQDLDKSPHVGVVLMVTQEHLDIHKDINEYVSAKEAIVKFQTPDDFEIINEDYPQSLAIGKLGKGRKIYFSKNKFKDYGLEIKDLQLRGEHNLENISAAIEAAKALDVPMEVIRQVVMSFKGLKHRLEFVVEKKGVKFYNDSFSTTPETAIAAIKAFTEPEILILGGSSKKSDFTELGKTIASQPNIKTLIIIGQEGPAILAAINQNGGFHGKILTGAASMEEIFTQIRQEAGAGDAVILSPACASFGMFKNYQERGDEFRRLAELF